MDVELLQFLMTEAVIGSLDPCLELLGNCCREFVGFGADVVSGVAIAIEAGESETTVTHGQ